MQRFILRNLEDRSLKTCRGPCGKELPVEVFGPRRAKCNDCRRAYDHDRNAQPAKVLKRRLLQREKYAETSKLLIELKNKPCVDCGGSFPPYVMDFDHRDPSSKHLRVSLWAASGHIPSMLREIAKCDLVCSNCHRIRTFTKGHNPRWPKKED